MEIQDRLTDATNNMLASVGLLSHIDVLECKFEDADKVLPGMIDEDNTYYDNFHGISFWVNGERLPPIEPSYFILTRPKITNMELFTCSCGNAGCAGWWCGQKIKTRKNTVEWTVLDNADKRAREKVKRFYRFSRENYDAVVEKVLNRILELDAMKPDFTVEEDLIHWQHFLNWHRDSTLFEKIKAKRQK